MMLNWVIHILFVRKRGLIVYLAALKKGLFDTHIRTMSCIVSYSPPSLVPSIHGLLTDIYWKYVVEAELSKLTYSND